MTALDFANNNSFTAWSMKHLSIDMNEQGNVIVSVPDTNGTWSHVTCLESKTNITPVTCSCGHDHCQHQAVVTAFYARIYKQPATPVVVEPQVVVEDLASGNRPLTAQEWKAIIKRDKIRQRREKDAEWKRIERARAQGKARAS